MTEPQIAFSPDDLKLAVQVLRIGRVCTASWSGFIEMPMPVANERLDGHLSNSHVHNIQLLREPWQTYKRENMALRAKRAIFTKTHHEWWDTAIQTSIRKNLDGPKVRQWARIVNARQSRSSGEQILHRLIEGGLLKLHVEICNNLAANKRSVFLIAPEKGRAVVANGPSSIRKGDKIVKITRYASDPHLAVQYNRSKGYHEVVGTVALTTWAGDIMTQGSLKRAKFASMVLGLSKNGAMVWTRWYDTNCPRVVLHARLMNGFSPTYRGLLAAWFDSPRSELAGGRDGRRASGRDRCCQRRCGWRIEDGCGGMAGCMFLYGGEESVVRVGHQGGCRERSIRQQDKIK